MKTLKKIILDTLLIMSSITCISVSLFSQNDVLDIQSLSFNMWETKKFNSLDLSKIDSSKKEYINANLNKFYLELEQRSYIVRDSALFTCIAIEKTPEWLVILSLMEDSTFIYGTVIDRFEQPHIGVGVFSYNIVLDGLLVICKKSTKKYWLTSDPAFLQIENQNHLISSIHEVDEKLQSKYIYRFSRGVCTSVSKVVKQNGRYKEDIYIFNSRGPELDRLLQIDNVDDFYKKATKNYRTSRGLIDIDGIPYCYMYPFKRN